MLYPTGSPGTNSFNHTRAATRRHASVCMMARAHAVEDGCMHVDATTVFIYE